MKTVFAAILLVCLWQQAVGYYCRSNYYDCGDGYCVPDDTVCDGTENCLNGADEDNCPTVNVGLAVGLAIAGFVVFIILPVVIVVVCCCCCIGVCATAASGGTRRTHYVRQTTASAGPQVTVVSSNSSNTMQAPVGGTGYPPAYTANPSAYQPAPAYKV